MGGLDGSQECGGVRREAGSRACMIGLPQFARCDSAQQDDARALHALILLVSGLGESHRARVGRP